jgi:hypothetical protein
VLGVLGVVGVVPVVVVAVAVAEHDSATSTTGSFTGNDNADNGVPGGTSTVKLNFAPPATVTVTTHSCAPAADGNAARPATSEPAAANQTRSFRLLITWPISSRRWQRS